MWRQKKLVWTTFTREPKSISEDLPQVFLSLDSSNFPYVCYCGLKSSDFRFMTDKVTRVRRIFFLLYLTSNHILIFIHKHVGSHSTSFWILMEFEKRFHNWLSELFQACTKLHENHENDYYLRHIIQFPNSNNRGVATEKFLFLTIRCCYGCLRIDTMRHVGLMCLGAIKKHAKRARLTSINNEMQIWRTTKLSIYSNLLQLFHLTQ